ncbi:MAG TPA: hypothetical protein VF228_18145 [Iamia sp.]
MALATRERQQIYTRLAPVIGEEEAGTLLDQFPSTADTELATVADLKALDAKIDMVEARLIGKMEAGFERLEKLIYQQMRRQTILMFTMVVAVVGLAARTNIFG